MRWHEIINESTRPSWLGMDNPGGEWLERAKEKCRQDPRGIKGNSTGYTKKSIKVLLDKLISVAGYNGEHKFRHLSSPKRDALLKSVDATGFDNRDFPILIGVGVDGTPYIMEGNHRTSVAFNEGKQFIWAAVQWYGGSESLDGEWSPAALQRDWDKLESRKAIDEAFDAKEVEWQSDHKFAFDILNTHYFAEFIPNSQMPGHYHFAFGASYDDNGQKMMSTGNTGNMGRSAVHVLAHVVSGIEEFLRREQPQGVEFTADKEINKADLYLAMAKRLKSRTSALGYRVGYEEDSMFGTFFIEPRE